MSAFEQQKKRYLPTTLELHRLRQDVTTCDMILDEIKNSEQTIFCQLSRIRREVQNCLSNFNEQLSSVELEFFNAWKLFSNLPSNHYCYLPPLYKSKTLQSILETAVKRLLQREVGIIAGSDNNVGHLVLGGVEGAGKTTLMRALALGSAALLQKIIPICYDHLIFKKPEDIVREALGIYYPSYELDPTMDPLDVLNSFHRDAFLLLDEFQHNFIFTEDPSWINGKNAAQTLHRYSRTCGTFGVIGGSSVDMHTLMFKQGSGESTDYWRKHGYPNFNGTLYELRTVPALRTVGELKDYVNIRYPLWSLNEEDLSLLLTYTGGIGRRVHTVWVESEYHSSDKRKILLCSEECLRACTVYRKLKHEKVLESADNRNLIAYLLATAQPIQDNKGNILNCGGVEKSLLLLALRSIDTSSPSDIVEAAEANSIIYINENSFVQFSRPVDAVIFGQEMHPSQHKLLLLSAIHLMVNGISGCDNGNAVDVNARYALEEFVRENVYSSAGINEHARFKDDVMLAIMDGKLCKNVSGIVEPLTFDSFCELNLQHLTWKKEHGLDGMCFEKDELKNNHWYLDLWQCKGGRWDVEIGGGNKSMATACSNYKKNKQLKDVGDKQITEIVLKAQIGICILVKALREAIPGVVIQPRRLVITTTKKCNSFCLQTLQLWEKDRGVVIEKDVLIYFGMNSRSKSDVALKSRFDVKVESGCSWVVNAVPDSSLRVVARELLLNSSATTIGEASPSVYRTKPASCTVQ